MTSLFQFDGEGLPSQLCPVSTSAFHELFARWTLELKGNDSEDIQPEVSAWSKTVKRIIGLTKFHTQGLGYIRGLNS